MRYIFESYNNVNPLTEEEKQAIPYMLILIGALESAWAFNSGNTSLYNFHVNRTEWLFSHKHTFLF
jgi:Ser/Thr protein kinase RdoA (MazF antagonist)